MPVPGPRPTVPPTSTTHPSPATDDLVEVFLDRGHGRRRPDPGPVPPSDDRSTLYVSSGMQPLRRRYTGEDPGPHEPCVGVQSCVRLVDVARVGRTDRHLTSFRMLGQFCWDVPDYRPYLDEGWSLLVDGYGLPESDLHVTHHADDERTGTHWRSILPSERVWTGGDDNFWRMGPTGPCGPCTELFVCRHDRPCGPGCSPVGCDCDRWLEVYNLVMTQYVQGPDGIRGLPGHHLDTGLGLERLRMCVEGAPSVYDTSDLVEYRELLGLDMSDWRHRVLVDHSRTLSLLLRHSLAPGPKGREYVLRRLVRRMLFYGDQLGLSGLGERIGLPDEERRYRTMLKTGYRWRERYPVLDDERRQWLHSTHGLNDDLIRLIWEQRV